MLPDFPPMKPACWRFYLLAMSTHLCPPPRSRYLIMIWPPSFYSQCWSCFVTRFHPLGKVVFFSPFVLAESAACKEAPALYPNWLQSRGVCNIRLGRHVQSLHHSHSRFRIPITSFLLTILQYCEPWSNLDIHCIPVYFWGVVPPPLFLKRNLGPPLRHRRAV